MLNFISFGSGSSGNCYYLFTPTDGLLIDTGVGLRTLKKNFKGLRTKFIVCQKYPYYPRPRRPCEVRGMYQ